MNSKKIKSIVIAFLILIMASCSFTKYAETNTLIINAKSAIKKIESGYIPVDAQKKTSYEKEHLKGAVNIERRSITIADPVPNSLTISSEIARVAGLAGLTENSNIVIYDDNINMDSSRLFWTLKTYGHKGDILIVSGGLAELKKAGSEITDINTVVSPVLYEASPMDQDTITNKGVLVSMIDNPDENFKLLDVRSDEEYYAGTIPGSIHINHEENLFNDFSFRHVLNIKILYKEMGILPEDNIVMFCKSSIRATNTYAALYNAGYRNLKIYDGAWLEWTSENMPIYIPEIKNITTVTEQDNS